MNAPTQLWSVPDSAAERLVRRDLQARCAIRRAGAYRLRRTFYDSFDWRLFRAGFCLYFDRGRGDDGRLSLYCFDSGCVVNQPERVSPLLAGAVIPDGPIAEVAAALLKHRRISPVLDCSFDRRKFVLSADSGRAAGQLYFERLPPQAAATVDGLEPTFSIVIWQGEAADGSGADPVAEILQGGCLPPPSRELVSSLLANSGRVPGAYRQKFQLDLAPDATAGDSARAIFLELLSKMEESLSGAIAAWDPEYLHDFRIAVRRTRSGIGRMKGLFDTDRIEDFAEEFKWLGQVTSATRDLDVYQIKFAAHQSQMYDRNPASMAEFLAYLGRRQAEEQKILAKALKSRRRQKLFDDWRLFLQARPKRLAKKHPARQPVKPLAQYWIWRAYKKVVSHGRRIDGNSPSEALHELRKECKKLRYLLEFFRTLFPQKKVARLIRSLKELQDNLGDFQDFEVQRSSLHAFSHQMRREGETDPNTLMAMGALAETLARGQHAARQNFHKKFAKFDRARNRAAYWSLFRVRK